MIGKYQVTVASNRTDERIGKVNVAFASGLLFRLM
jgi:hypothetical protein